MSVRGRASPAIRLGLLGLSLLVITPVSAAETGEPAQGPVPGTRAECEAAGGQWDDVQGRGHVNGCNPRTKDGGKACSDSDQCEGACQRGKCTSHRFARGCGIAEHGKVLCLD